MDKIVTSLYLERSSNKLQLFDLKQVCVFKLFVIIEAQLLWTSIWFTSSVNLKHEKPSENDKRESSNRPIIGVQEWGRVQTTITRKSANNGSESQKIQVSKQKLLESLDLIHQK